MESSLIDSARPVSFEGNAGLAVDQGPELDHLRMVVRVRQIEGVDKPLLFQEVSVTLSVASAQADPEQPLDTAPIALARLPSQNKTP
jgi:hypothetical protein